MDIQIILLNYQLNVSNIINQSTLAIIQTYITFWQHLIKIQENNTKILIMTQIAQNIYKAFTKYL